MGPVSKLLVVAGLMGVAALPARAQTTGGTLLPTNGGSITVSTGLGGWSFRISGCTDTLNGVAGQSCSNDEVVATVNAGVLSLVFESRTGGTLQSSASNSGVLNDISLNVDLFAPGHEGVSAASISVAGSAADPTRVGASETITTVVNNTGQPNMGALLSLPSTVSQTFTPISNEVGSVVDLSASGLCSFGCPTGAVTMTSATLTFTAAPEPISSSLLAVGAIGIGLVRRRVRRTL